MEVHYPLPATHYSLPSIHDLLLAARQYGQFPELPLRLATGRRQVRQFLRRAGQEGAGNRPVAPFVNLSPEVLPDFRRLHEIETVLAAGQMPRCRQMSVWAKWLSIATLPVLPDCRKLTREPN